MEDFIKIEGINKNFSGLRALKNISFSIKKGDAVGLCGANGSGKSTLIKILAGVLRPDTGSIKIEGTEMVSYGPLTGIRHGISVIYQDISLFPALSVLENICLARTIERGSAVSLLYRQRRRAGQILDDLGVAIDLDAVVEELPIASQQLIAIARALNNDSKLIILDEPTTALTSQEIRFLFKIVRKLKNSGISVIFISHKIDEIIELCDTVTILRDGELIASKPVQETTLAGIEQLMVGQSMEYAQMEAVAPDAPVVLEVSSLSKKNNFKDISFTLRRGEILGVIGLLGSGRTELALSLFGMYPADSGSIAVDGRSRRIKSVQAAVKAGIAYVPEDRLTEGLVMNYPIRDNIVLVTLDKFRSRMTFLNNGKINKNAAGWVDALSIKTENPANLVSTLSGGNQQKIVLAKWLEENPKVLILDGPTVGIDIGAKAGIFKTLKNMIREKGMGVLLISDEIKEIVSYSHRVMIIRSGRVVRILQKNEISEGYIQGILSEQKQAL
ncbi:MAG: sugar ABC transporter ATP-binding protein [Treponema sp.]|jgi:simple sugar transport system ATP-binding protein|nr:sugar ABC transporter ATP-binding protein [Treponema sp.]